MENPVRPDYPAKFQWKNPVNRVLARFYKKRSTTPLVKKGESIVEEKSCQLVTSQGILLKLNCYKFPFIDITYDKNMIASFIWEVAIYTFFYEVKLKG